MGKVSSEAKYVHFAGFEPLNNEKSTQRTKNFEKVGGAKCNDSNFCSVPTRMSDNFGPRMSMDHETVVTSDFEVPMRFESLNIQYILVNFVSRVFLQFNLAKFVKMY